MKKAIKQSTLVSAMSVASILLLVGVSISFVISAYFNSRVDTAYENRYELTYNANRFMNGSAYLTNEVRAYAATGHQEHYDNYWNEINNLKNRDIGVANLKAIGITSAEQNMIDEMSALSNSLVPLEEDSMENVKSGNTMAALDYVYGEEYSTSIAKINTIKSQFLDALDTRSANEVQSLKMTCAFLNGVVWFMIVVVILLQIVTTIYNRRKIIRPIIQIEKTMLEISKGNLSSEFKLTPDTSEIGMLVDSIHRTTHTLKQYIGDIADKLSEMAKGNMTKSVEIEYIGDFAPIQTALNTILDSLNKTLGQIGVSSAQVSSDSDQVAQAFQELTQGAAEQASSIEEISAAVNDLSARMSQIAENALQAKTLSDGASDTLNLSNQKMRDMTKAMQDISDAEKEIGKIIDTIENIAFQTNILALNAAVEAARAGAAGKGFAVVADEVRSLANKSQEASKETTLLIERSLQAVENGSKITVDTAETLKMVVEGARQSTTLVDEISVHSEEQAEALRQLTNGVDQIAGVIQTTSATAEESAIAAQKLNTQASILHKLIAAFKVRGS